MEKETYFPDIIGQDTVKKALGFYLDGYKATGQIPHMMFTAPRGCGKTTMATAMAKNLTDSDGRPKPLITLNCSTIKSLKQFFNQFVIPYMNDRDASILFDECSELPKDVTMGLLTILNPNKENRTSFSYEDYTVDFDFKRLSFLFATTEGQSIFHALMDRMERIDLEEYTYGQLGQIVLKGLEGYTVDDKALSDMATTLRGNARAAQKMAVKLKLLMDAKKKNHFNNDDWKLLMDKLGVLPLGLSKTELQILRILAERKEVRLTALAAITNLSKGCIQKDYELYLTKMGLMEINSGGRSATAKGLDYLKKLDGKTVSTKRPRKSKG
jgi:Holliday junction resolvasome RuvABC ATP-dependent DNA helicase subunit